MGWYSHYLWDRKDDVIRHLDEDFTNNVKLVRSSTVGNNHWQLIEITDGDLKNERFINLNMLSKSPNGSWSYKPIDETMGPVEVNCPVTILNQATETNNKTAKKWREAAYAHHEERKQIRAFREELKPGYWLEYGGTIYMLDEDLGRRGWLVNSFLRMSSRQINNAIKNYLKGSWSSKGYMYFELGREARLAFDNLQAGDTVITYFNGKEYVLNEKLDEKGTWLAVNGDGEERFLESKTLLSAIFDKLLEEHDEQERKQTRSRPSM